MTHMLVPEIDVNEGMNKPLDKLTKPWKFPLPTSFAFTNGTVIDTLEGKSIHGYTVLTKNGFIENVVLNGTIDLSHYKVIDCTGKFLCPGLFDFHVHMTAVQGEKGLRETLRLPQNLMLMRIGVHSKMMIERGFTSIRDCGGMEHYVADAIEDNIIIGPRSFFCGKAISQTGGHADLRDTTLPGQAFESCECHLSNLGVVADGVDQCMKAARENFRRGASFIKIMSGGGVASPSDKIDYVQYTDAEIQSIVAIANNCNSFVTAHAYTPKSIKKCVANGVKGIEHGNLIDAECAKLLVENDCYICPTLVTYKVLASDQFSEFLPPSSKSKNEIVLKKGLQSLLLTKKYGVKTCFGSDLLGNLCGYQNNEFAIRAKVLEPSEILKSATVTPAEIMKLDNVIGQISKGFYADILILDQNPLVDIKILDKPENHLLSVLKNGLVYHTKWELLKSDVPDVFSC